MTAFSSPITDRPGDTAPSERDRLGQRLVPLTGVATVTLVIAGHLVHGSVPAARADVAAIVAFYRGHDTHIYVGSVLLALAAFFFVAFAAQVRTCLRQADGRADTAGAFAFAGATLFAVGLTLTAGIGVALGHQPARLDPSAIQALHALFFDLFAPLGIGAAMFLVGNGTVILATRTLPTWLGWSALGLGALALAPEPVGDIGFIGLGAWLLVTSAVLARRRPFEQGTPPRLTSRREDQPG